MTRLLLARRWALAAAWLAACAAMAACGDDVTCGAGTRREGDRCVAVAADVQCGPGTQRDGATCQLAAADAPAAETGAEAEVESPGDAAEVSAVAADGAGDITAAGDGENGADAAADVPVGDVPCICPDGSACLADGSCPACLPSCGTKTCGDDGCGGSCGGCPDPLKPVCLAGECTACVPQCAGANCGPDGCGGTCGICGAGTYCLGSQCGFAPVDASCNGLCGGVAQNGCSCKGDCKALGTCCIDFADVCGCVPDCAGKSCGGDGCGGSCGACGNGKLCQSGSCVQNPCLPDPCSGHGQCAPASGACTCAIGYAGGNCEKCASGFVDYPACTPDLCQLPSGAKNCSGHGQCQPKTGACLCDLGFGLPNCATCSQAGEVFPDCNNPCQGKVCDDKNACTTDSCNAKGACVFAANQAKCDDGNPCTDGDVCAGGACTFKDDLCQFKVTSGDDADDGVCDAKHCSFREAIAAANASGKAAKIGISKAWVITRVQPWPAFLVPVQVDGLGLGAVLDGGGAERLLFATQALTLRRLTLRNGHTQDQGGAVYANAAVTAIDVAFIDNFARFSGGAIYGQTVTLNRCLFRGNKTAEILAYGGAIYALGSVQFTDTWFDGNNSSSWGGAVSLAGKAKSSVISGCTFSGNHAGFGGAALASSHLFLTVVNSTFVDNAGAFGGSAIDVSGPTSLLHVTLSAAATATGKAQIAASADLSIGNSAIIGASAIALCDSAVTPTTVATWVGDGTCGATFGGAAASLPKLGQYGGYVPTLALPDPSTAVDAGNAAVCASLYVGGVDQRGLKRPYGKGCDLGAFELGNAEYGNPCASTAKGLCDDGNACTSLDLCQGGSCGSGKPINCSDGNACTLDSCDPLSGCVFAVGPSSCDDGNACTSGDSCQGGVCMANPATNCDDGNACTADSCAPNSGCSHAPQPGPCSDDDLCTVGDVCKDGTCTFAKKLCAMPALPGLAARYSAAVPSSLSVFGGGGVLQWRDLSGNGRHLEAKFGPVPLLDPQGIAGMPGIDFGNASGLQTAPFALNAEVTFFAVVRFEAPKPWGSLAHHGNHDMDWSLENNGAKSGNVVHFQSDNDNTGGELSLNPGSTYVLCGRVQGGKRWFSASTTTTAWVEASGSSIQPGSKPLYVGKSDGNEASLAAIGEILYYDKALSDTDRDAVLAYLRAAWQFGLPKPDVAWYDAADVPTLDKDGAGNLTGWNDKSGQGRHALVGSNEAPLWTAAATPNGSAAVTFNGSKVRLQTAAFATSAQLTLFAAVQLAAPQKGGAVVAQGHDQYFALRMADCCGGPAKLNLHIGADNTAPLIDANLGAWQLVTAVQDATTAQIYAKAGAGASALLGPIAAGTAALTLGNAQTDAASMGGALAELRVYGQALTPMDRAAVEQAMRFKAGLGP